MKRNITYNTLENPNVYVKMLGGFQLKIGDQVVLDSLSRSANMWNLLSYLIINRDKMVSQEEFIELLWPDEEINNPANALKTVLYRTRATLAPHLGPQIQLILSQRGSYSWNSAFPCTVDAEEFTYLIREASNTKFNDKKRMELYKKALLMYKGDFLPKLAGQLWVIPLSAYYHSLYVEAVLTYADLLIQTEKFADVTEICSAAVQIEPFDERLHGMLITSLVRQGKNNQALNHYETATDLLYRNLGVHPSPELRELYLEIMKEQNALETDLGLIQNDLKETAYRSGSYFCEYGVFKEIYRLEVRRALRHGSCLHLALMTVSLPDGTTPALPLLNKTMEQLQEVIMPSLRRGDVFCRYSGAQYALLLPSANYENGVMILERIVQTFYKQHRSCFLKINYKLQPLGLDDIDIFAVGGK